MSEEERLKGRFLFDDLVAESLGGGGLSGAPLGGGLQTGMTFPCTGLGGNLGGPCTKLPDSLACSRSGFLVLSELLSLPDATLYVFPTGFSAGRGGGLCGSSCKHFPSLAGILITVGFLVGTG